MYLFCKRPHNQHDVTTQDREAPPPGECSFLNPRAHMTASVNSAEFVFSRSSVLWEIMLIWIQRGLSALGVFAWSADFSSSWISHVQSWSLLLFLTHHVIGLMKSSCADQNLYLLSLLFPINGAPPTSRSNRSLKSLGVFLAWVRAPPLFYKSSYKTSC